MTSRNLETLISSRSTCKGQSSQCSRGGDVLRGATLVQTEVEFVRLYEKQPLFGDIDLALRSLGYQFHTFLGDEGRCFKPIVLNKNLNQRLRQILWADAVYVKD